MLSPPRLQVTEDVARCKPIAQSLDNVELIGCDYIMDSVVSGAAVCRVTHVWGVAVRSSCPPYAQDEGCREGSGMHRKQCSASASKLLWLRDRARLSGVGGNWGVLGAKQMLPVAFWT